MDIPVFLIHGLGASQYTMSGLEKYLKYYYNQIWYLKYPSTTHQFSMCMDYIVGQLQELLGDNQQQEIIIIGQSMGGVFGCFLSEMFNVKHLITIGSPLKGARIIKFLRHIPIIYKILYKPMYDYLVDLIENPLKEPKCNYHCISMSWPFTTFDGCVFVDEAKFDDNNHTHLNYADHRTIFANPRLWYCVKQIIY